MGTSLHMLTNSKIAFNESEENLNKILQRLKDLNLDTTSYYGPNNTLIKETGTWDYFIDPDDAKSEYSYTVSFEGPFSCLPTLHTNVGVIWTIYKYRLIYETTEIPGFDNLRQVIYSIVKAIGGTEIIYVADNACNKLSGYLAMAWENIPYDTIKKEMIKEFGNPIIDYGKLDFSILDYKNINEFFFDDFSDLQ